MSFVLCEVSVFTYVAIWLSTVTISAIYDVIFGDLLKGIWSDLEFRMFIPI
jgi:hypothetical protein